LPFFPCVVRRVTFCILCILLVLPNFTETLSVMIWHILDIFFVCFHSLLIVFNLFGWIWKRTRILSLIVLGLTGASWLFLGLIVGTLGYCPLTDWHFRILEKLGKTDLPDSYIKYLADRLTGLDINASLVDSVTLYAFLAAFTISIILNLRDFVKRKNKERNMIH
jgi:hypothetical protein